VALRDQQGPTLTGGLGGEAVPVDQPRTGLERAAKRSGIETIYLLTESASTFFLTRGYAVVARAEAPEEIRATEEFSTLCAKSAFLMRRTV
jgi:N-acetylglutamate synthase-like GNAT family acetyltransferase